MSFGYNSKVLTFPGLKLQKLLFYKDISGVQADCNLFGLTFTNENILFQKSQFKEEILQVSIKFRNCVIFFYIFHFIIPFSITGQS